MGRRLSVSGFFSNANEEDLWRFNPRQIAYCQLLGASKPGVGDDCGDNGVLSAGMGKIVARLAAIF